MKRVHHLGSSSARLSSRSLGSLSRSFAVAAAAVAAGLVGGTSAHAFGGGEYIVHSEVVSDTVVGGANDCASGDCGGTAGAAIRGGEAGFPSRTQYGQPDLFYNYYTQSPANAANAQMYLAPVPVPPHVGHTFYTYQPFYPHEMLYKHKNRFHNYYDNGRGLNRTRATYSYPPVKTAISNVYWNYLRIPR